MTGVLRCPECGLVNPGDAVRCDCKYVFGSGVGHSEVAEPILKRWARLFTPIYTEQDAVLALGQLSRFWFGWAIIQALRALAKPVAFADGIFWALVTYFLPRSRGRALAALTLFAAAHRAWVAFAFNDFFGLTTHVGTNIFRAIPAVAFALAGLRGVEATVAYHRIVNSVIIWKHVAIVWALFALIGVAASLVVVAVVDQSLVRSPIPIASQIQWIWACWIVASVPMFVLARSRFPWARPRLS